MDESDKDQHNSPMAFEVQDYGSDSAQEEKHTSLVFESEDEELEILTTPAASNNRLPLVIMIVAAFLLVSLSGLLAYQQQMQLQQLQQKFDRLAQQQSSGSVPPIEQITPNDTELELLREQIQALTAELAVLHDEIRTVTDTQEAILAAQASDELGSSAAGPSAPPPAQAAPMAGDWYVNLNSFQVEANARRWAETLPNPPSPVQVVSIDSGGDSFYRVRVAGFSSREEARAWADKLELQWQLEQLWVSDN
jgi:hypothetical protein